VASALRQELPEGHELEVVIAVSDPSRTEDVQAAQELGEDRRVRVAMGSAQGAGAARNAAIEASSGFAVAFMDDDCEAQEGWLREALKVLEDGADLVQGRTTSERLVNWQEHSVEVDPPSWLWETCNLLVRRSAIESAGGFHASWSASGKYQWGEDTEWGWRLVRAGARPGFAPKAVVYHQVQPWSYLDHLRYRARQRNFPRLIRTAPEVRQRFYHGYFLSRRHAMISVGLGMIGVGIAARVAGRRGLSTSLIAGAGLMYLKPYAAEILQRRLPEDVVDYAAVLYGSIRYRRLLI